MFRFRLSVFLLGLVVLLGAVGAVAAADLTNACRQDLAQRLKLDVAEITVAKTETVTWPNAALGLERPDKVYADMLTSGLRLELQARRGTYYYHTSDKRFSYAGRAEMWNASALYLMPIEDEPNLNGTLVQVSLLGTNPRDLLKGVSDFAPQADGSVLATRRTSRSGFDLLYLAPDARGEAKILTGAFEFARPVLAPQGGQYAVFSRQLVGRSWGVERGALDGPPSDLPVLPVAGQPVALTWGEYAGLQATVRVDHNLARFNLVEKDGTATWAPAGTTPEMPHAWSVMLNKSFSLVAKTTGAGTPHPVTRVYMESFQGDQSDIASLDDFQMDRCELSPDMGFVLLVGQRDAKSLALTVDRHTGEVLETLPQVSGPVHLGARPSQWEPPLKGQ